MKNNEKIFISPFITTGTKEEVFANPEGGIYWDEEKGKCMERFTLKRLDLYDKLLSYKRIPRKLKKKYKKQGKFRYSKPLYWKEVLKCLDSKINNAMMTLNIGCTTGKTECIIGENNSMASFINFYKE